GLRRLLLGAAERMAAQCGAVGDNAGAIAALERLVAIEPSNERAQRDMMQVVARRGRYTDALRQSRICCEALRRDLDVAPEPATDSLYRELMRRRRAAPAPPPLSAAHESRPAPVVSLAMKAHADADSTAVEAGEESTLREAVVL